MSMMEREMMTEMEALSQNTAERCSTRSMPQTFLSYYFDNVKRLPYFFLTT